jgi:glutaredoxin 3
MSKVVMYTTRFCPFCMQARALLDRKGVAFEDLPIDHDPKLREEMMERSRRTTVPQIWIGGEHIGGCDELYLLDRAGKLDGMLGLSAS